MHCAEVTGVELLPFSVNLLEGTDSYVLMLPSSASRKTSYFPLVKSEFYENVTFKCFVVGTNCLEMAKVAS